VLTFDRAKGEIRRANGTVLCLAQSGYDPDTSVKGEPGEGVGHPELEAVRNVGPLPAGYYVLGKPFLHPHAGPFVMRLFPVPGTVDMHGRDGMLWHGGWKDPTAHKDNASHGCITSPLASREAAWLEGDHLLHVV
jgi:hypothetical protein